MIAVFVFCETNPILGKTGNFPVDGFHDVWGLERLENTTQFLVCSRLTHVFPFFHDFRYLSKVRQVACEYGPQLLG